MANNLDRIVTVDIDIASPLLDETSFDHQLILGPAPAKADAKAPAFGVYRDLNEVEDAGFVTLGDDADIVGVAARVHFSNSPDPVYIAVHPSNTAISHTLKTLPTEGWYVISPVGLTEANVKSVIEWVEAHEKMCSFTAEAPLDESYMSFFRSFAIFPKTTFDQKTEEIPVANKCMNVAFAAKCLRFEAGSETWAFKTLAGVTPAALNSTETSKLEASNISFMLTTASKNITYVGKTLAGEWIDVIRFRDWLKNDMQNAIANLFIVNPKVPYTDKGIGLVDNQMRASLLRGVDRGGIAPREFNENGEEIPSFWTRVPKAAEITGAQKASRILKDCKFAARIAGAIHVTDVKGSLTYEL